MYSNSVLCVIREITCAVIGKETYFFRDTKNTYWVGSGLVEFAV